MIPITSDSVIPNDVFVPCQVMGRENHCSLEESQKHSIPYTSLHSELPYRCLVHCYLDLCLAGILGKGEWHQGKVKDTLLSYKTWNACFEINHSWVGIYGFL